MEIKINEPWITDKVRIQNGYAYIDHPFWNAEKQQADHKREYIGKYDGTDFKPKVPSFYTKDYVGTGTSISS